jgi:lysophospholipase L1-like esterase
MQLSDIWHQLFSKSTVLDFLSHIMKKDLKIQNSRKLNKYKQANSVLESLGIAEDRIVFIGDSITEFWGTINPDFFENKNYINRGISGQTSPQILLRFSADVIALKPTAVVILAGVNDIAGNTGPTTLEEITDTIFSMIELAEANYIKVILCSVLPASDFPWSPKQEPADKIIALNTLLINYASANAITFVDYHTAMADDKMGLPLVYSSDGVHPNKAGYEIMGPLVEKAIQGILTKQ